MKKRDIQIVIAVLAIALISFIGYRLTGVEPGDKSYVIISIDGEEYKKVSLADPQIVVIDKYNNHNEIEITSEAVSMHNSSCENQICIHQGEATLENIDTRLMGGWIVCLPNKITIELVKGEIHEN